MADTPTIFPSILPPEKTMDKSEILELLNDDHKLVQQAAVVCKDFSSSEIAINGQSSKTEVIDWLAANMERRDIETIARKAKENLNE
jgi:hypothetical protein